MRCDQNQPTCVNCQKGSRACWYDAPSKISTFRGFRHVSFRPEQLHNAIVVSDQVRRSVEYFCVRGLPILRRCQPSPLWDFLVAQLLGPESSVRQIAAALGSQQRIVDQQSRAENQHSDIDQQARQLYAGALSSLRQSIGESCDSGEGHLPLACLLMVILESIRGSRDHLLVHLRCGLCILRARRGIATQQDRAVASLLRQYAVEATVFDPISPSSQAVQLLIAEHPDTEASLEPTSKVLQLVSDLLQSMTEVVRSKLSVTAGVHPPSSSASLGYLREQQRTTEHAVDTRLAASENLDAYCSAMYSLAKVRCLMLKIYIECAWTGRQTDYDAALDLFRQIVDIEEKYLLSMQSATSNGGYSSFPAAFSVGLSAQATLMCVIQQCRDADTRRRALRLLKQCPRYEGVYNTVVVEAVCRAIIEFEELCAGGTGRFIPEYCRVHHYNLIEYDEERKDWRAVRLYYRGLESGQLCTRDVQLQIIHRPSTPD